MPTLLLMFAMTGSPAADGPVAVPPATPEAMRYYRSGVALWVASQALLLAIPAGIAFSGLSARLWGRVRAAIRRPYVAAGVFGVLYVLVDGFLSFPFRIYAGYVRPRAYGLSIESFANWLGDEAKGLGVVAALAFALLGLPVLAIRRLPRAWPVAVTVGYVPVAFAMAFLAPIVVDPLFNDFGPMKDRAMEAKILAMADRAGIDGGRIFEVDKSKQTRTVNAYVTGFLGSKRIVLWDTLLAKLPERQVLFILGHEMGHYALGHVTRTLALSTAGVLALCLFLQRAGAWTIARCRDRLGFDSLASPAALPLALFLGGVFALIFAPIGLAYSRSQEHEADRFALELTRDNRAGAEGFVALQRENLSNPYPGQLSILWRSTHPPLGERVAFCNAYRPWEAGQPGRYAGMFRGGSAH